MTLPAECLCGTVMFGDPPFCEFHGESKGDRAMKKSHEYVLKTNKSESKYDREETACGTACSLARYGESSEVFEDGVLKYSYDVRGYNFDGTWGFWRNEHFLYALAECWVLNEGIFSYSPGKENIEVNGRNRMSWKGSYAEWNEALASARKRLNPAVLLAADLKHAKQTAKYYFDYAFEYANGAQYGTPEYCEEWAQVYLAKGKEAEEYIKVLEAKQEEEKKKAG